MYTRYVEGCTDIMWHTQIQSPPLVLDFETKNKDWYKKFTSPGQIIDYIVWPAVFLYENGPLLAKGIAQFTKGREGESIKTQVFNLQSENKTDTGIATTIVEPNQSDASIHGANVLPDNAVNDTTYNFNEKQRHIDVETNRMKDVHKEATINRSNANPVGTNVKREMPKTNHSKKTKRTR